MKSSTHRTVLRNALLALVSLATLVACAHLDSQAKPTSVPVSQNGYPAGYLAHAALPNSLALLPPPPAAGSTALALDKDISKKSLALRGSARWQLAAQDADLNFPQAAAAFTCALDAPISEQDTPQLYTLMRRSLSDVLDSTDAAKDRYKRARPFAVNQQAVCTPKHKPTSGSYPSGHSATGWSWALILSEVDPAHTDALINRGWAFGQSRVICNVHWQSDVIAGRNLGAAVVARLHAEPAFRDDLKAAQAELAAAHAKGLKPTRDCAAEAAALRIVPSAAPWPANK